jgi:Mitochondrial carrier protein
MQLDMVSSESITGSCLGGRILISGSFWTYEKAKEIIGADESVDHSGAEVMLCGGIAGVATWVSIYPLDVIKTRIQGADLLNGRQPLSSTGSRAIRHDCTNTWATSKQIFQEGGARAFFNGLGACSSRAFLVNAVQVRLPLPKVTQYIYGTSGTFTKQSCGSG